MTQSVSSVGLNVKKLALGKLSDETVKEGYKYLKQIEAILNSAPKLVLTPAQRTMIEQLSSKFYTFIPHDFGRANIAKFIINSPERVKEKTDLIQSLVDINIVFKNS